MYVYIHTYIHDFKRLQKEEKKLEWGVEEMVIGRDNDAWMGCTATFS